MATIIGVFFIYLLSLSLIFSLAGLGRANNEIGLCAKQNKEFKCQRYIVILNLISAFILLCNFLFCICVSDELKFWLLNYMYFIAAFVSFFFIRVTIYTYKNVVKGVFFSAVMSYMMYIGVLFILLEQYIPGAVLVVTAAICNLIIYRKNSKK